MYRSLLGLWLLIAMEAFGNDAPSNYYIKEVGVETEDTLSKPGIPCEVGGKTGVCFDYEVCHSHGLDLAGGIGRLKNCTLRPTFVENRAGCGWRNPDGVGHLYVDKEHVAKYGEFPWMTAVLRLENGATTYLGAGSLIHPSVLLTAAHILRNATSLRIRAGEWDTASQSKPYPHQTRDVDSVEIHENYMPKSLSHDIALLFLDKPMRLAPNVGLVCLPKSQEKPQSGIHCFSSGWRKDQYDSPHQFSVVPYKFQFPVISNKVCQELLQKTRLGPRFELHTTLMCTGRFSYSCKGDGGSPLVCPMEFEKDRYVQSGMVAWGIGCGEDGSPGVYVDVAMLRDWIDDKVAGKGHDVGRYANY